MARVATIPTSDKTKSWSILEIAQYTTKGWIQAGLKIVEKHHLLVLEAATALAVEAKAPLPRGIERTAKNLLKVSRTGTGSPSSLVQAYHHFLRKNRG